VSISSDNTAVAVLLATVAAIPGRYKACPCYTNSLFECTLVLGEPACQSLCVFSHVIDAQPLRGDAAGPKDVTRAGQGTRCLRDRRVQAAR
jgi:hypothetical protein